MTTPSNVSSIHANTQYKPKAIIFDLLTALLDSWTLWDTSIESETRSTSGQAWRERYLDITFNQGRYAPYESLVRRSATDVGLPLTAPENLLRDWHQLRPWPEVPGVLAKLKTQGVRLAIVTNCSDILGREAVADLCKTVRETTGVEIEFDAIVTAEKSGWYKPWKEAYEAGLNALQLVADEVLFVAGSAGDVEGATSAGMKVVWNNHVGLRRKGNVEPLKEGRTLDQALSGILSD